MIPPSYLFHSFYLKISLSENFATEPYKEYLESGELHQEHRKKSKYSEEQKRIAVNHYFEYGQCYARTIRMLGYPNRESLRQWCEELAPGARKLRKSAVKLTQDQKEAVLKKFYKPQTNRKNLAESEGISRVTLCLLYTSDAADE